MAKIPKKGLETEAIKTPEERIVMSTPNKKVPVSKSPEKSSPKCKKSTISNEGAEPETIESLEETSKGKRNF